MRRRSAVPLALLLLLVAGCTGDSPLPTSEEQLAESRESALCELGVEPDLATGMVESMATLLRTLADEGVLRREDARATSSHLENVRRSLSEGRTCPALAQMRAFREHIRSLRRRGVLGDAEMAPLLKRLRVIRGATPLPGDPSLMYAPGATGEVRTVQIEGEDFTYEVLDGLAIFNGDMILGYADEFEAGVGVDEGGPGEGEGPARSAACHFFHFTCERWHDQTIGYDFADDWGSDAVNADMRRRIRAAIGQWDRLTGIRFVRRTSGERAVFQNSTGCSSNVGRRVVTGIDPQGINVGTMCGVTAIAHEIGHAVGLYHEQARNDRDGFVRILWDNIDPDRAHNFATYGGAGFEVGDYEYGSLMHYGCGFFRADGATGNTLEPTMPGVTCADLGGGSLTPTDVLGAYRLYPPDFTITGASPGETADRFTLEATFSTKPVRDELIFWISDRVPGWWAQGRTASTGAAALPQGDHLITARVMVAGEEVASRSIRIRISGHPPSVDLGPDRTVDLNRRFSVSATVTDVEDGACPITVCTYTWSPAPEVDGGGSAAYRFETEGPRTIQVTVRDGSGLTATDELTVDVVNSPPTPVISEPHDGSTYLAGTSIQLRGFALDINEGPGPGPGTFRCGLSWTSSDPSDVIDWGYDRSFDTCSGAISFGDPGVRTIRLTATDPQGLSASTEAEVTVTGCGGGCDPIANINISNRSELDGSTYSPPFTGPGFYLNTQIFLEGQIIEGDDPPDSPLEYEWRVSQPCFGPSCPPDLVLERGTTEITRTFGTARLAWTPADDISAWSGCVTTALPFTITFRVQDSSGATDIASRTVHLACTLR